MSQTKTWLVAALVLAMATPIAGAAQVAVRLIYATNTPIPAGEKGVLAAEPRLVKAFGWREYQLLSQTTPSLHEGEIHQLDLGRKLQLTIKLLKDTKPAYFMRCQLFREEKELLQTSVSMTSGSSYFITGPEWDNGQLLISIAIR